MRNAHRNHLYPLTALVSCVLCAAALAQSSSLTGRAISPGPNGERFAVPEAKIVLTPVSGAAAELPVPPPVASDGQGVFEFLSAAEGCYLITAESAGLRGQSDIYCLPLGEGQQVTVEMGPKIYVESVDVTASAIAIDATETSSTGSVGVATLYDAPKINKRYTDAMPLIPGVLKDSSGEINLHGARSSQSGAQFNGVDITDPVIGSSPFNVPLDTVSNVQVLSNPSDAQYGGFMGAVSTVETKPADMSDYKVGLQDFLPRLRRRDGNIVGIEAFAPRFTITGPIRKGKLAFLHSTEYHFIRIPQDDANLDPLARDTQHETLTIFNQLDARHTDRNSSTISLLIYPAKVNFHNLNAFNEQPSTPDLRRRGFLVTYRNRHDFRTGAALLSQLSYQDLEQDVKPRGFDPYTVGLEKATGSFFNRESRVSSRWNWKEQYSLAPVSRFGDHLPRVGFQFAHESYQGTQTFDPITWLGVANTPVLRADFSPTAKLSASKQDYAGYLQDKWQVIPSLTLDLGFRIERDSIASRTNPSFRTGFAYAIGKDSRTVLRGGAGLFYGRTNLIVPVFPELPARTETTYGADGQVISELAFANRLSGALRNPRSLGWDLQLEREVISDLFIRAGYQQRSTTDNYIVDREVGVPGPEAAVEQNFFILGNGGRDNYREWQFTARYRLPKNGHVTGSYVRSSSVGDLNDLGSIYGPTPAELIRPNERAPLAFDAPNRLILWGEVGMPLGLRAIPVLELRSGFPYSNVDEYRDYAGPALRRDRGRRGTTGASFR